MPRYSTCKSVLQPNSHCHIYHSNRLYSQDQCSILVTFIVTMTIPDKSNLRNGSSWLTVLGYSSSLWEIHGGKSLKQLVTMGSHSGTVEILISTSFYPLHLF